MFKLTVNNDRIRLRPSAIDSFYGCGWQWAKNFLEGSSSIVNSRSAIGTAIHRGIEVSWREAMEKGKADHNIGMMADAAIECWKEETKEGVGLGANETVGTCEKEIVSGITAWKDELAPFIGIPSGVEKFYAMPISNPFVEELGGTVDYIGNGCLDDVKTSKRKTGPEGHQTQQSIYKILAEHNGETIKHSRIQQVVLTKTPTAAILTLEPNIDRAKLLVNNILETLEIFHTGKVPAQVLFRGNPKYMFCAEAFCAHYSTCPWVKGNEPVARKGDIAQIKL